MWQTPGEGGNGGGCYDLILTKGVGLPYSSSEILSRGWLHLVLEWICAELINLDGFSWW